MPLFVGSGTTSGGGFEAQSSQAGIPTALTDPQSANVGDVYIQSVGSGATMKLYDGSSWNQVGGAQNIVPNISGGDPYAPTDGFYEIRTFTTPGTLSVSTRCVDAEAIIIAGGGGGSVGGGGAGGVIGTSFTLAPGSYPIVVGYGGTAAVVGSQAGTPGGHSVFNGFTAFGGGGGAGGPSPGAGCPGGSGGGGNNCPGAPSCAGGSGVDGQGTPGGSCGGSGGGYVNIGKTGDFSGGKPSGGSAGFTWGLPNSILGTDNYGLTRYAAGGASDVSSTLPALCTGAYGDGGHNRVVPAPDRSEGCTGAVFIRFKKCQ